MRVVGGYFADDDSSTDFNMLLEFVEVSDFDDNTDSGFLSDLSD